MQFRFFCAAFLGFLLLVGCTGPEQLTSSGEVVPPKTNTIYVVTEDVPDEAFKKLGRILQAAGYDIRRAQAELGFVETSFRRVKVPGYSVLNDPFVQLRAAVTDVEPTRLRLSGKFRDTMGEDAVTLGISVYGKKNSLWRSAWSEMQSIAEQYEGATLEFGRM